MSAQATALPPPTAAQPAAVTELVEQARAIVR
jgi:hypothetical protein